MLARIKALGDRPAVVRDALERGLQILELERPPRRPRHSPPAEEPPPATIEGMILEYVSKCNPAQVRVDVLVLAFGTLPLASLVQALLYLEASTQVWLVPPQPGDPPGIALQGRPSSIGWVILR